MGYFNGISPKNDARRRSGVDEDRSVPNLARLMDEIKKVATSREVVIGGDFNLTVSLWPGPERPTCKQNLAIRARLADGTR
jgi:hypothetical protein